MQNKEFNKKLVTVLRNMYACGVKIERKSPITNWLVCDKLSDIHVSDSVVYQPLGQVGNWAGLALVKLNGGEIMWGHPHQSAQNNPTPHKLAEDDWDFSTSFTFAVAAPSVVDNAEHLASDGDQIHAAILLLNHHGFTVTRG